MNISEINKQMVEIPKGNIELRDDRTKKKWVSNIEPILLSKFLVTQKFYKDITLESPSEFKKENLPVESVSWKDAISFCNRLSEINNLDLCYQIIDNTEIKFDITKNGFRLPTEAEWQYSCKAGVNEIRYGDLNSIAWYKDNSENMTHQVGLKLPNNWGLYDMLGNVWEWCSDIYDAKVYGSYRIFRGGGWNDEERGVMSTNRRRSHPILFKIDDLGFRIAKNN